MYVCYKPCSFPLHLTMQKILIKYCVQFTYLLDTDIVIQTRSQSQNFALMDHHCTDLCCTFIFHISRITSTSLQ